MSNDDDTTDMAETDPSELAEDASSEDVSSGPPPIVPFEPHRDHDTLRAIGHSAQASAFAWRSHCMRYSDDSDLTEKLQWVKQSRQHAQELRDMARILVAQAVRTEAACDVADRQVLSYAIVVNNGFAGEA